MRKPRPRKRWRRFLLAAAEGDARASARQRSGVFLGIDPGKQRAGVAVSDETAKMAFPLEVLSASDGPLARQVAAIAADRHAVGIVVGLPRRLDGSEGPGAGEARTFAGEVEKLAGVPVHLFDERLTTVGASAAMRQGGVKARGQRGVVDKVAATLILQSFLDSRRGDEA